MSLQYLPSHRYDPRRARPRWARRVGIGLLSLASASLVLVACSSGSAQSETPTATPTIATVVATATPTPEPVMTYLVKSGDTGLAIAIRFDVTLADLAAANNMTEKDLDVLHIGQQLRIPR
ncbi:MAG: LysM peptidoglycan-binding domain-containing protein [Dehalococcoidia bacterium]